MTIVAAAILASIPTACRESSSVATPTAPVDTGSRRIVCTILPTYLFTRNLVVDVPGVEVRLLPLAAAGCPHDYELSLAHAKLIAAADVVVLNGGLERFAGEGIRRINSAAVQVEAWRDCIEATRHPPRAPHNAPSDAHHAHDSDDAGHPVHGSESVNPHVWLSPSLAMMQVRTIAAALAGVLPHHRDRLRKNEEAYIQRLDALRLEVEAVRHRLRTRRIVTTHDAFEYLVRDLGLGVLATIQPSPRIEPSAAEIARLVDMIRGGGAAAVFAEPGGSRVLAERIARDSGVRAHLLDPIVSVEGEPALDHYERVQRANLATLVEALR